MPGKDKDQNKGNDSSDKGSDEMANLLQSFYQPMDAEMQDFESFYDAIQEKLEAQNPALRISKLTQEMEKTMQAREKRLEQLITKIENKQDSQFKKIKIKQNPIKSLFSKISKCFNYKQN